jgi:subtilisin family serine protease
MTSPLGGVLQRTTNASGITQSISFALEQTVIELTYIYPYSKNGGQAIFINFKKPTPGIWEIHIHGDLVLDGRFNMWLPIRNFLEPGTEFLSADVLTTAVMPAASISLISVGAYSPMDRSIYVSSSRGPNAVNGQCPDFCAPGVNVFGWYPNNVSGAMSGTSVAAAIAVGAAALVMQWGIVQGNDPTLNTLKMRTYLIQGCTQKGGITYPDELWGYGEMNIMQTFNSIGEILNIS